MRDLRIAIELDPAYAWAWAYRFVIHRLKGDHRKALANLTVATQLDDTIMAQHAEEFGTLFMSRNELDAASACTLQGLRQEPHNFRLMYIHAVVHACSRGVENSKAEIERARAALESVRDKEPGDSLYGLAGLFALEGKSEEALKYLKEAVNLGHHTYSERAQHDLAWQPHWENPDFKDATKIK